MTSLHSLKLFDSWRKISIPFLFIASTLVSSVAYADSPFWIRVIRTAHPALTTGLDSQEPSFNGTTFAFKGWTGHIIGWFDAPIGNNVDIYIDNLSTGQRLATYQARLGASLTYTYSGFHIPKNWAGLTLKIHAKTIAGLSEYTSNIATLEIAGTPQPGCDCTVEEQQREFDEIKLQFDQVVATSNFQCGENYSDPGDGLNDYGNCIDVAKAVWRKLSQKTWKCWRITLIRARKKWSMTYHHFVSIEDCYGNRWYLDAWKTGNTTPIKENDFTFKSSGWSLFGWKHRPLDEHPPNSKGRIPE